MTSEWRRDAVVRVERLRRAGAAILILTGLATQPAAAQGFDPLLGLSIDEAVAQVVAARAIATIDAALALSGDQILENDLL